MTESPKMINALRLFASYFIILILLGFIPLAIIFMIWGKWKPHLFSVVHHKHSNTKVWAIALAIAYWVVMLMIWLLVAFLCLLGFAKFARRKKCDLHDDVDDDEMSAVIIKSETPAGNTEREDMPAYKAKTVQVVGGRTWKDLRESEKAYLRSETKSYDSLGGNDDGSSEKVGRIEVESYDSFESTERSNEVKRRELKQSTKDRRRSFRSGNELFLKAQDNFDIPRAKSNPDLPSAVKREDSMADSKLLMKRLSRDDSFKGLPDFPPFTYALRLVPDDDLPMSPKERCDDDSPMSPRERFFSSMISEKERLAAVSLKAKDFQGVAKIDLGSTSKLPTVYETKYENESLAQSIDQQADRSKGDVGSEVTDEFLPVTKEDCLPEEDQQLCFGDS